MQVIPVLQASILVQHVQAVLKGELLPRGNAAIVDGVDEFEQGKIISRDRSQVIQSTIHLQNTLFKLSG